MDTRTFGELRVLLPDIDPRDLDDVTEPPTEDLFEARVDGADWARLQLGSCSVRLSELHAVDLNGAGWRGVTVYGCRFERVDLSGARLSGAMVERCEFVGCRMTGLQLIGTTLKNVVFEDCRLDYATLDDVRVTGPVAWSECGFNEASLTNCRLPGVVIQCSGLGKVELRECDLRGADLRGTDLGQMIGLSSLRGAQIGQDQVIALAGMALREFDVEVFE